MNSFFDRLEDQLHNAAQAQTADSSARMRLRRGWLKTGTRIVPMLAALAVTVGVVVVALTIASHAHRVGSSNPPTKQTLPSGARMPNPFTIVARYSAASLGLNRPANLAIGPDGNLYVTDAAQHLTVISPDGKVLRRWGGPGQGPGEFNFVPREPRAPGVAAGIAVGADGRVYVDDSGNARVEVFSSTGRFIRQFGRFGSGRGQILFSNYLAVDASGNVYVADDKGETLSKYSPTGAVEWTIGGSAATDTDLVGHFHFSSSSIDSQGRLVITNDDRHRVLYIDSSGRKVDAFGAQGQFMGGACDATVNANGDTFVGSCQEPLLSPHYTEVFNRTHHLIGEWYPSPMGFSPRSGPHAEVFTLGEDGSILRLNVALPGIRS
jgi:hypothetical protein